MSGTLDKGAPLKKSSARRKAASGAGGSSSNSTASPPPAAAVPLSSEQSTPISLPRDISLPITISHIFVPELSLQPITSAAPTRRHLRQHNSSINKTTPLFSYYAGLRSALSLEKGKGKSFDDEEDGPALRFYDSPVEGEVVEWGISEGQVLRAEDGWSSAAKWVVKVKELCTHAVQWQGQCAICGRDLTQADYNGVADTQRAKIAMDHAESSLTVSVSEAERLESESKSRLLDARKLSLIVDLDQTVVHATVDPTVGEWMEDPGNPNWSALRGVAKFTLENTVYYVKSRPGLENFLERMSQLYEMHVYTMGTRAYAVAVCEIIDPTREIFGGRILSRDESGSMTQKNLQRLFPVDTSMVVIIDDRSDVWQHSPNLVSVIPYNFFVGTGDINGAQLPPPTAPIGPAGAPSLPSPASSAGAQSTGSTRLGPLALPQALDPTPSVQVASPLPDLGSVQESAADISVDINSIDAGAKDLTDPKNGAPTQERAVPPPPSDCTTLPTIPVFAASALSQTISEQLAGRPLKRRQEELEASRKKAKDRTQRSANGSGSSTPSSQGSSRANSPAAAPSASDGSHGQSRHPEDAAPIASSPVNRSVINVLGSATSVLSSTVYKPDPESDSDSEEDEGTDDEGDAIEGEQEWAREAVLVDRDEELKRLEQVLSDLHSGFYDWEGSIPSTRQVIAAIKGDVLAGCRLSFSGIWPMDANPEEQEAWKLAEMFGATCFSYLAPGVTHLVANNPGTAKANAALKRPHVFVVRPGWLHDVFRTWQRPEEAPYLWCTDPQAPLPAIDAGQQVGNDSGDDEIDIDWKKADDEVNAIMEETDDEGSDADSIIVGVACKRRRTSAAPSQGDNNAEAERDGEVESPLMKKQKLARARSSKLKLRVDEDELDASKDADKATTELPAGTESNFDEQNDDDEVDIDALAAELF